MSRIKPEHLQIIGFSFIMIGLFFSRALPSIGVGLYILLGFTSFFMMKYREKQGEVFVGKFKFSDMFSSEQRAVTLTYLFYALPVVVLLIGVLYTENVDNFLKDIRLRIPILLMPIAALMFPPLSSKWYERLGVLAVLCALVSSVFPLWHLIENYESVLAHLKKGGHLKTEVSHIRYSMLIAFSCLISLWYGFKNISIANYKMQVPLLVSFVYLFVFIHVLGVRTGIALTYMGLAIFTIWYLIHGVSRWKYFVPVVILFIPVLFYYTVPTLKMKIDYMIWDIQQWQQGGGEEYSDGSRLISYELALESLKGHYVFGHGSGDDFTQLAVLYEERYPDSVKRINAHNQFLTISLESGLLGLAIFIMSLISLFNYGKWRVSVLHNAILIGLILSFLTENTLDSNVGVSIFCLWTIMGLQRWRGE